MFTGRVFIIIPLSNSVEIDVQFEYKIPLRLITSKLKELQFDFFLYKKKNFISQTCLNPVTKVQQQSSVFAKYFYFINTF